MVFNTDIGTYKLCNGHGVPYTLVRDNKTIEYKPYF